MIIKSKSQSTGKFCDLKKQFLLSKVNKVQFPSSLFTYCGPFTLILCTYHIKDRDFQYVLLLCESESFITLILWYEIYLVYSCFFDSYSYLLGEVFPDSLKKTNWLEIPNNVSINTFLNFFIFYTTYHPLRAWHHNQSIRHRTHCVFVITTSPLISYPILYDIITTFVWHHTHYAMKIKVTQ